MTELCECLAERAAILEYEAGLSRDEAEALAQEEGPLCDEC